MPREHSEWRDETRRLILSAELLELPLQRPKVKERVDVDHATQQRLEVHVNHLETAREGICLLKGDGEALALRRLIEARN